MQQVSEHQCGWSEEVSVEVEALQAMYDDEVKLNSSSQQVSMLILPLQASSPDIQQHFVECHVVLNLPPVYPSKPPEIQLTHVKGFSIRQHQLLRQLSAQAIEMQGELQLGLLFEAVRTWLTEHNCPEGPCIFCLEELSAATGTAPGHSATALGDKEPLDQCNGHLLRLPCFHAYHRCCFADWWCWQQQTYQEQQDALERKTGAIAAAALAQEALPPKDGTTFQLSCPSCRVQFQKCHLPQPMQQQLQRQLAQLQQQSRNTAQQPLAAAAKLSAAQLQPFLELQRRHAVLFAQQQQRQGIIDTQASYSITDWQATGSDPVRTTPDGCDGSATVPPVNMSDLSSSLSSSFNRCVHLPSEADGGRGSHSGTSREQAFKTRSRGPGRARARGRSRGNSRKP